MATAVGVAASFTAPQSRCLNSVSGLLALLQEDDHIVQTSVLRQLSGAVDKFWPEIADGLSEIEKLSEDEKFPQRPLASLVASMVYFHLEEYTDALRYGLGAGKLLDLSVKTPYTQTIIAKSVETYVHQRQLEFDSASSVGVDFATSSGGSLCGDPRLEEVVERLLEHCIAEGDEYEALGVAFESRRLDKVESILRRSKNITEALQYCSRNATSLITSKRFRQDLFELLVSTYDSTFDESSLQAAYSDLFGCLFHLGRSDRVAHILASLLAKRGAAALDGDVAMAEDSSENTVNPKAARIMADELGPLTAYQLAFDLVEFEDQAFLRDILAHPSLQLPELPPSAATDLAGAATASSESATEATLDSQIPESAPQQQLDAGEASTGSKDTDKDEDTMAAATATTDAATGGSTEEPAPPSEPSNTSASSEAKDEVQGEISETLDGPERAELELKITYTKTLRRILSGETSIDLTLQFLHRNNHTDLLLLDRMRSSADQRNSIIHTGLVKAHSMMQAGTTCDTFLRTNLDWLGKAIEWAKFGATASIGVIHKGHVKQSRTVLATYLPGGGGGGVYSEGGSLYALGLIHANQCDEEVKEFILNHLRSSQTAVVKQHGACLGLGLLAMGSADLALYEELKAVLFMDSAIAGEAAGIAIGLVMLGTASQSVIAELLAYAHDTQHEKISRACMMAIAMVMYHREQEADALVEQLSHDKDWLIRYGAMNTIGMAYCGTSDNSAIRHLLHSSASDVSDDVRRAAVLSLGFVLCNQQTAVVQILSLLSDSFNPHVRYASALAVGIACAGTAREDVVDLLVPMIQDSTDFVRQAALLALGLVLMQSSDVMLPKAAANIRDLFLRISSDKHEDVISRLGAIVGHGLLDAGGRNVAAALFSATGNLRRQAVVGFFLFSQIWYWFPLVYCVSLTFRPLALIGLTKNMEMPKNFAVYCSAPVSRMFDYPAPATKERREDKKEAVTAVLSTTKKRQVQEKRRLDFSGPLKHRTQQKKGKMPDLSDGRGSGDNGTADVDMIGSASVDGGASPRQKAETSSVVSEPRSTKGVEISSTAATLGDPTVDLNDEDEEMVDYNSGSKGTGSGGSSSAGHESTKGMKAAELIGKGSNGRGISGGISGKRGGGGLPFGATVMMNPCRILPQQEQYVSFAPDGRYVPVFPTRKAGFVMLQDTMPSAVREDNSSAAAAAPSSSSTPPVEATPPEPFEWSG